MRYLLTRAIQHYSTSAFPLGTMIVNITGCFLIGILYGLFERNFINSTDLRLFLTVGVCGGFTTFSTFVHDNYTLFNDRNIAYMILYSMLSLGLGLLFAHWGHVLIKSGIIRRQSFSIAVNYSGARQSVFFHNRRTCARNRYSVLCPIFLELIVFDPAASVDKCLQPDCSLFAGCILAPCPLPWEYGAFEVRHDCQMAAIGAAKTCETFGRAVRLPGYSL